MKKKHSFLIRKTITILCFILTAINAIFIVKCLINGDSVFQPIVYTLLLLISLVISTLATLLGDIIKLLYRIIDVLLRQNPE